MSFRGVFIGIDRYASDGIGWLSCARRDAMALEALFSDTLGGASRLLIDQDATRAGIEAALDELAACAPDDTVVITFSGHGSPTHELVTYDADIRALAATALPLDDLAACFAKIPAKRVVLLLDCCFSGGIGAKVLQVEAVARQLESVDAKLQHMSGEGRLILTASGANEPAWENPRIGHGNFTHFLLQALQGVEEVVDAGRIPVLRLLEFVTRRVVDAARQYGHSQQPALRGTIDSELVWPVFVAGPRYAKAFPERVAAKATADIASLAAWGFPAPVLSAWSQSIPSLNQLQLDAINDYQVLDGEHLVVVAPTSSGKTMVGELAALKGVTQRKRAIFLLPLKALVADKKRHFKTVYGDFGLHIVDATGETDDISPVLRGQYDIALITYEKFAAIALTTPHVLEQAGLIVVDETQMIADLSRGANLEFLLTLIKMRRKDGIEPQVIALSGVIGDVNGFDRWLGARLLRRDERPVPLEEGLIMGGGDRKYLHAETGEMVEEASIVRPILSGKNSSQDLIIPLARKLIGEGEQLIVFRENRGATRGCANYLANSLGLPPARDAIARLPGGDTSQASEALRTVLAGGVAFHNSHLSAEERRIIEEEFRRPDSALRVIVATTTLAMGVNTPASSVIIAGLQHPGDVPYSVAEYKNLVGRAGRLGYTERGKSYLVAMNYRDAEDYWRNYVLKKPEDLVSRFLDASTDPRSLIVRVMVAGGRAAAGERAGMTAEQIATFLESSFGAFQQMSAGGPWNWDHDALLRAVANLERHQLVEAREDGRLELTPLGRLAGESAVEVLSIIRLVECLRPLRPQDISDPALIAATQATRELEQVYVYVNKKTPREAHSWMGELRAQGVHPHILHCLEMDLNEAHDAATRAKRAVAALAYVSGQEISEIEQLMARHGGPFDGAAGPVRNAAARISDLVGTAARVAELLHPDLDLADRVERLNIRLTLGIPGAAVDLARQAGATLSRGDYRRLLRGKLCDPEAIAAASDEELLACLDGDRGRLAVTRTAAEIALERRESAARPAVSLEPYAA
ncbi:DEAD/DEAH box helicase [Mesorhizobium sp. CA18]|uniref:DEAD/DEAH box helicase n=1 Tax=unclassified Mesorhizobium TaxID=325217 RepID=UPI001CCBD69B|nr:MULTISPECIES: DEAD/DEAH box helicase [unclassified Mesorhizobium]MBZ9735764.1 DEAD/DEAH box helicase [Mesorhizobium sp. CA9]MBZ9827635.1 DEAD/DEAH box helicase [Mesorhizobium sp. CA18]MBZ9833337.1 DEAD/DEAH box helicase [Mesorhizobium sp. CA2]MBZ9839652.1 DEAD/DEAH box helicase [Mesorhizobium sp. CA3]MBZ9879855.1 DEAD/DEAH box helicase [Mesorhizobium sp. Ca11]